MPRIKRLKSRTMLGLPLAPQDFGSTEFDQSNEYKVVNLSTTDENAQIKSFKFDANRTATLSTPVLCDSLEVGSISDALKPKLNIKLKASFSESDNGELCFHKEGKIVKTEKRYQNKKYTLQSFEKPAVVSETMKYSDQDFLDGLDKFPLAQQAASIGLLKKVVSNEAKTAINDIIDDPEKKTMVLNSLSVLIKELTD